jgi:hypothetical protein
MWTLWWRASRRRGSGGLAERPRTSPPISFMSLSSWVIVRSMGFFLCCLCASSRLYPYHNVIVCRCLSSYRSIGYFPLLFRIVYTSHLRNITTYGILEYIQLFHDPCSKKPTEMTTVSATSQYGLAPRREHVQCSTEVNPKEPSDHLGRGSNSKGHHLQPEIFPLLLLAVKNRAAQPVSRSSAVFPRVNGPAIQNMVGRGPEVRMSSDELRPPTDLPHRALAH